MTWKFWKWHQHKCRTMDDDTGCWGECIVCGERFGFVTRAKLRAYCDREIERAEPSPEPEKEIGTTAYMLGRGHTCSKCESSNIPCEPEAAPPEKHSYRAPERLRILGCGVCGRAESDSIHVAEPQQASAEPLPRFDIIDGHVVLKVDGMCVHSGEVDLLEVQLASLKQELEQAKQDRNAYDAAHKRQAAKTLDLMAQLAALKQQLADEELTFNHANEVIGLQEKDNSALKQSLADCVEALKAAEYLVITDLTNQALKSWWRPRK